MYLMIEGRGMMDYRERSAWEDFLKVDLGLASDTVVLVHDKFQSNVQYEAYVKHLPRSPITDADLERVQNESDAHTLSNAFYILPVDVDEDQVQAMLAVGRWPRMALTTIYYNDGRFGRVIELVGGKE